MDSIKQYGTKGFNLPDVVTLLECGFDREKDSTGLLGAEIDTEGAKAGGRGLLRRAIEYFGPPGQLEVLETARDDNRFQLCFQQSAGDSALPQIDVPLGTIRYRLLHHDVADLYPPSRLQHPMHLLKNRNLVGAEVDDPVGDDDIGPAVVDR
jgi:hypothetical protein